MKKYEHNWLEDFLIRSTWATNAIEGNSLSLVQTMSIILDGTVPVKSNKATEIHLRDIKEVENGEKAFNAMLYSLGKKWPLNEELIKTLHNEITKGLIDRSGQWKIYENQVKGANFKTVSARETPRAIDELLKWYQKEIKQSKNLIQLFADFHVKFETIHPFEDGNGRIGRLLLNYQLMSFDYFPVCFPLRKEYLDFLANAQEGAQSWQDAKAPKDFVKLIQNLSKVEKERHNIFEKERELKLTQEHYNKKENNEKE